MAEKTKQELLAEVNAQLSAPEERRVGNKMVRLSTKSELLRVRDKLMAEIAAESAIDDPLYRTSSRAKAGSRFS